MATVAAGSTIAGWIAAGSAAVGAGATIYSGIQQSRALDKKAKQAEKIGKGKEISRLKQLQQTLGLNIAAIAASNGDFKGTHGDILESNVKDANYDLAMIRANTASSMNAYGSAASSAATGGIISGIAQGGSGLSKSGVLNDGEW